MRLLKEKLFRRFDPDRIAEALRNTTDGWPIEWEEPLLAARAGDGLRERSGYLTAACRSGCRISF